MSNAPPPPPMSPDPLGYATPLGYAHAEVPTDPGNVWKAIWTRPREVMRWVLATDPTRNVPALILGGAFANAFGNKVERADTLGELVMMVTAGAVIGTAVGFLISYFVAPALLTLVGRWLGGQGDRVALRAAVAYAAIPAICTIPLALIGIAVLAAMLADDGRAAGAGMSPLAILLIGVALAEFVLGIWTLIIFLACVAAAHRFSMWLALATLLLIGLVVLLAILAVVLPITFLAR